MTIIIITLLVILIFGFFILHLFDNKKIESNFNKVNVFKNETSKSLTTIIKAVQKVERDIATENGKIVNEHILLVKLLEKLNERGIINMDELLNDYKKNLPTETSK